MDAILRTSAAGRAGRRLAPVGGMLPVRVLLVLAAAGVVSACTGSVATNSGDDDAHPDAAPGASADAAIDPPPACLPACAADELCVDHTCTAITGGDFVVDVASAPHPIHPEIYGLAFADDATLRDLHVTVNRWGGNGVTLYNWQLDTGNTASDWY